MNKIGKPHICIFAKPAIPGHTKTRLAKDIGEQNAAKLSAAMLYDLAEQATQIIDSQVCIQYPPNYSPFDYINLKSFNLTYFPQEGTNLGERMFYCFKSLLEANTSKVVIIGSDCVSHTAESLKRAIQLLDDYPVVIQPAEDGGYTLIGMTIINYQIFNGIQWGGNDVMALTKEKLITEKIPFFELPMTFDVDTIEDIPKLIKYCKNNIKSKISEVLLDILGMTENIFFSLPGDQASC